MSFKFLVLPVVCLTALGAETKPAAPVKTGVKKPGLQAPMSLLQPEAEYPIPGSPDWIAIGDSVWISNYPKNSVTKIDPKTNKIDTVVEVGQKPCAGLVLAFDSLWVPLCGDHALVRVDPKTNKITATIPTTIGDSEGGIAAGAESIWLVTDKKGTLARIDPATNQIVAEIELPAGSYTPAFGEGSVWVTGTDTGVVSRVNPATNLVVETIKVGKQPRFLAVGEGAVWVLNQGDGSVSKIDPKTNKVDKTIEVGVPGTGGDIAVGEGSVWVTAFEFPISRIDPAKNEVVQQFKGPGGDAIRVGLGSVWLSCLAQHAERRYDPRRIRATVPE